MTTAVTSLVNLSVTSHCLNPLTPTVGPVPSREGITTST